eukprot:m.90179 g.90179  ORF g.90179 m.90179 type:complete len:164 (-) comp21568_c0_seq2:56-547(-)
MGGPCMVDGRTYHEMDNFGKVPMEINGKKFNSTEIFFQYSKYTPGSTPGVDAHLEQILASNGGTDAWQLGQSRKFPIRSDWEAVKVDIMYQGNLAKFSQHEPLKKALIATKGHIKAVGFPFWVKWNGIILERIREELRPEADKNVEKLRQLIAEMEQYKKDHE